MHGIVVNNVTKALSEGVNLLILNGVQEETRAGPCLVIDSPVVTVTRRPAERVLFSATREANPFFHMIESLWMLAGRNDVAPLLRYVKTFDKFAESDGVVHGAYGHRWRKALGFDQLNAVVEKLRNDPGSRQAVIQMWDATDGHYEQSNEPFNSDDYRGSDDLRGSWKDRPCNTHIYLRVRTVHGEPEPFGGNPLIKNVLDLTVCCRSNDAILGCHGANAVHFSVLQEYLAARLGVGMGRMYQWSNNYHGYLSELKNLRDRAEKRGTTVGQNPLLDDRYETEALQPMPMFSDNTAMINTDIDNFFEWHDGSMGFDGISPSYFNSWFATVAERAALAHWHYRQGNLEDALDNAMRIEAQDWRVACTEWIQRRMK